MKEAMAAFVLLISLALLTACGSDSGAAQVSPGPSTGQIYLYGETHGVEAIMAKQLESWHGYYTDGGLRHLFVELPYYTAEFLNVWMKSDSNDILNDIYDDIAGTAAHVPYMKVFYTTIKEQYPETVFHGTDVGHQHQTTGQRFLIYLEQNGLQDTEAYRLTQEAIEQGKRYYSDNDYAYRENMMTDNFIRAFDSLIDKDVMGIYGAFHTTFGQTIQSIPGMADQLRERYGGAVHTEDLTWLAVTLETKRMTVGGKEYEALYFGEQDVTSFSIDFIERAFWRLENAYDDFKDNAKTGNVLPYHNYPLVIEQGQVFAIEYTRKDGSLVMMYFRSDGNEWQGYPTTEEFVLP
ncbi:MAG: hypothetical protein LBI19_03760 [Oscillospiraceae bacterium]|jgi:hypothetical protein|nr:hypothetical protein [Oscillospiraceae bacterium]